MGHHLTPAMLERLWKQQLSVEQRRAVVAHLLGGCERCRKLVARELPVARPQRHQRSQHTETAPPASLPALVLAPPPAEHRSVWAEEGGLEPTQKESPETIEGIERIARIAPVQAPVEPLSSHRPLRPLNPLKPLKPLKTSAQAARIEPGGEIGAAGEILKLGETGRGAPIGRIGPLGTFGPLSTIGKHARRARLAELAASAKTIAPAASSATDLARGSALSDPFESALSTEESAAYDAAFDRALAGLALHGPEVIAHKRRARLLVATLRRRDPAETRVWSRRRSRYPLFEALLTRAWELRYDDPEQMVQLAFYATEVAAALGQEGYSEHQVADFQARAWGEAGNALRVAERFDLAESTLARAMEHWEGGTRETRLRARLLDFKASLSAARHNYAAAIELLDQVHQIYRELGDSHCAGRALISKAIYTGYAGEPRRALALLRSGTALIDESREPQLAVSALHSQALFLTDAGQFRSARAFLWRHRLRFEEASGRLDLVKLRQIEGRINLGLGKLERAEQLFADAKAGFEQAGLDLGAAKAALDLASVWTRQDRQREARKLVEDAMSTFVAMGIDGEPMRALELLEKAFAAQAVESSLLESVVSFLRRHEYDPSARLELRA